MINPQIEKENKPDKIFKQSPEVREYFKIYHRKRRIKIAKCEVCKGQATLKTIEEQKKLCLGCFIKYLKEKEKTTNAMPIS
jgi:hypothetical protein